MDEQKEDLIEEATGTDKEPDFVIEMAMQNLAEALEDYFVKHGLFVQGDRFERLFLPFDMKMISENMTFILAANVTPSQSRFSFDLKGYDSDPPTDPKKLN